jgi:hypothetical protein
VDEVFGTHRCCRASPPTWSIVLVILVVLVTLGYADHDDV